MPMALPLLLDDSL